MEKSPEMYYTKYPVDYLSQNEDFFPQMTWNNRYPYFKKESH